MSAPELSALSPEPKPAPVAAPVVVLVRPQLAQNIGAVARVMLNFGLQTLRLVAPRDGWPNPDAWAMASGADRVLEAARVYPDVAGAVGDCSAIFATTARPRELALPTLTPWEAMSEAVALSAAGARIAFLFGPERSGLTNDDLAPARAIVTVPVNPAFPSLNLAQAVAVLVYEWAKQSDGALGLRTSAELMPAPGDEKLVAARLAQASREIIPAPAEDRARFLDRLETLLEARGFFRPPERAPVMKRNLRTMFARFAPTSAELQTLYGVVRHLVGRS